MSDTLPREIEAKYKVADFTAVRRAMRKAGAEYLGTVLETDEFFDAPDRWLSRGDCCLRIRRTRVLRSAAIKRDTRPLVTYKGPRSGGEFKSRTEVQTRADDADAIGRILGAAGVEHRMTIQKRRASYRLGECLVELDELPLIGCFVEIEGPSERTISRTRETLRLEGEAITDSYTELLADHCRRAGLESRTITFGAPRSCPGRVLRQAHEF